MFTIKDPKHAKGGAVVEADTATEAARCYAELHCDDISDGDEANFEVVDEHGTEYDATVEVEEIREMHTFVMQKRNPKAVSK